MSLPPTSTTPPSPEEQQELEAMERHFGNGKDLREIYRIVEGQHNIVHARATSLIQLAGVVITVTGFSGRIIADTSVPAQLLIVAGLSLVLIAAGIAILRVMPIRWLTSYMNLPEREWLLISIRRRESKSKAFALASAILIFGMVCYVASISIMLLNPQAAELHKVR